METDSKYKILLADDEPRNVKDLFEALNSESYRVFVASNGESAVEQTLKHQPDTIEIETPLKAMIRLKLEHQKIINLEKEITQQKLGLNTDKSLSHFIQEIN